MHDFYYDLALMLEKKIPQNTLKQLLTRLGSAEAIYSLKHQDLRQLDFKVDAFNKPYITEEVHRKICEELEFMNRHEVNFCSYAAGIYPQKLKQCQDAPVGFFYKGNINFAYPQAVAVVGTRNATPEGIARTQEFITELAESSITVISGLAHGIDGAAHHAALNNHLQTIGVLGHGFSQIYPKDHKPLSDLMLQNGGLISEYFASAPVLKSFFPRRNRIIAGLSDAVVVVESAEKGGSLITAFVAHSYNRDVFAFPGRVTDENAKGCHALIKRNYAGLIENTQDFLTMMNWDKPVKKDIQTKLFEDLTEDEQIICNFIAEKKECLMDDLLLNFKQFNHSKLSALLLNLELKAVLHSKPGQKYSVF